MVITIMAIIIQIRMIIKKNLQNNEKNKKNQEINLNIIFGFYMQSYLINFYSINFFHLN